MAPINEHDKKIDYLVGRLSSDDLAEDRAAIPGKLYTHLHGPDAPEINKTLLSKILGVSRGNFAESGTLSEDLGERVVALWDIERSQTNDCWTTFSTGSWIEFVETFEIRAAEIMRRRASRPSHETPEALLPLQEDLNSHAESMRTQLASFDLRTGQSGSNVEIAPGEVQIGFDLNCPPGFADDAKTGVKRGVLVLDCGTGQVPRTSERPGSRKGGPVDYDNARLSVDSVDRRRPSWLVESIDGAVIGLVESVPSDFISVSPLWPGCSIEGEFRAAVKDIETTFVLAEDTKRSAAFRKIKQRIQAKSFEEVADGEVRLAAAEIKFKAKDAKS